MALKIPTAIATCPTKRLRVRMQTDDLNGQLREIIGARAPTLTPASRPQETFPFLLGSAGFSGETTLGSLTLVFAHQAGTDIEDAIFKADAKSGAIELDFRTAADATLTSEDNDKFTIGVEETTGKYKGLSRVYPGDAVTNPAADSIPTKWKANETIKPGSVIQLNTKPTLEVDSNGVRRDLFVISHIDYSGTDNSIASLYALVNNSSSAIAALGPFTVRDQSVLWKVYGNVLSYNPSFDEQAGLSSIEIGQSRPLTQSKVIRSEDVDPS